jgi:hypothetical protein
MTISLALTFVVAFILGRVTKRRPVVRHSASSQYFLKRAAEQPYMKRWDADAVRTFRGGGAL